MTLVPVLTAVSDARWEAELVAALERGDLGVTVVRRCVDLADLLATAATGQARAVLLSADLRRLDRDALTRLSVGGVAVVGLVPPHDQEAERRLRQLGVVNVLPSDASPADISAAVIEAVVALTPAAPIWPRSPTPGPPCPSACRRTTRSPCPSSIRAVGGSWRSGVPQGRRAGPPSRSGSRASWRTVAWRRC